MGTIIAIIRADKTVLQQISHSNSKQFWPSKRQQCMSLKTCVISALGISLVAGLCPYPLTLPPAILKYQRAWSEWQDERHTFVFRFSSRLLCLTFLYCSIQVATQIWGSPPRCPLRSVHFHFHRENNSAPSCLLGRISRPSRATPTHSMRSQQSVDGAHTKEPHSVAGLETRTFNLTYQW